MSVRSIKFAKVISELSSDRPVIPTDVAPLYASKLEQLNTALDKALANFKPAAAARLTEKLKSFISVIESHHTDSASAHTTDLATSPVVPVPTPTDPKPTVCPEPKPVVVVMPEPTVCPEPEPVVVVMPEPTVCPFPEPIILVAPEPAVCPEPGSIYGPVAVIPECGFTFEKPVVIQVKDIVDMPVIKASDVLHIAEVMVDAAPVAAASINVSELSSYATSVVPMATDLLNSYSVVAV